MITGSYMHPITEKMMLSQVLISKWFSLKVEIQEGRLSYKSGLNLSYNMYEWLNFSALSNYTWKKTDSTGDTLGVPEYELHWWCCFWHKLCLLKILVPDFFTWWACILSTFILIFTASHIQPRAEAFLELSEKQIAEEDCRP